MDDMLQPWPVRRADDEDEPAVELEKIDLQALAEEVYELLRQELRIERERRGWRRIC